MEFEPIRWRLARQLHAKGVHVACHSQIVESKPIQPVSYRLEDGTVWKPNFNGVLGFSRREVHH